jgi:hypothetical protein
LPTGARSVSTRSGATSPAEPECADGNSGSGGRRLLIVLVFVGAVWAVLTALAGAARADDGTSTVGTADAALLGGYPQLTVTAETLAPPEVPAVEGADEGVPTAELPESPLDPTVPPPAEDPATAVVDPLTDPALGVVVPPPGEVGTAVDELVVIVDPIDAGSAAVDAAEISDPAPLGAPEAGDPVLLEPVVDLLGTSAVPSLSASSPDAAAAVLCAEIPEPLTSDPADVSPVASQSVDAAETAAAAPVPVPAAAPPAAPTTPVYPAPAPVTPFAPPPPPTIGGSGCGSATGSQGEDSTLAVLTSQDDCLTLEGATARSGESEHGFGTADLPASRPD